MYSTRAAQQTAIDAVQIFGGRGITQSGMGRLIEHVRILHSLITVSKCVADSAPAKQYYRTVPFDALLGGGMYLDPCAA